LLKVGNISAYVRGIANNSAYAGGVEIILHRLKARGICKFRGINLLLPMRYINLTNAKRYPVSPVPKIIQAQKQLLNYRQSNRTNKLIEKIRAKKNSEFPRNTK
jgi:hypothetical protein